MARIANCVLAAALLLLSPIASADPAPATVGADALDLPTLDIMSPSESTAQAAARSRRGLKAPTPPRRKRNAEDVGVATTQAARDSQVMQVISVGGGVVETPVVIDPPPVAVDPPPTPDPPPVAGGGDHGGDQGDHGDGHDHGDKDDKHGGHDDHDHEAHDDHGGKDHDKPGKG